MIGRVTSRVLYRDGAHGAGMNAWNFPVRPAFPRGRRTLALAILNRRTIEDENDDEHEKEAGA